MEGRGGIVNSIYDAGVIGERGKGMKEGRKRETRKLGAEQKTRAHIRIGTSLHLNCTIRFLYICRSKYSRSKILLKIWQYTTTS